MKAKIVTSITGFFLIFIGLFYAWKAEDGSSLISLYPLWVLFASALGAIVITFIGWFFDDCQKKKTD
jgi:uncharacterized membrane protein YdcZ (DUF606 family)